MKLWLTGSVLCGLAVAAFGVALAQTNPSPPNARPDLPATPAAAASQNVRFASWKSALPSATGPLKVLREEPATLPQHTIFRPTDLPAKPLPIIAFANGGCRNTPIEFTAFLTELASHGYFIIAQGTDDVDFAVSDYSKVMPDGKPVQGVGIDVLTGAVDWAEKENARRGGPYFGKLDVKKVVYMGQSCGGLMAVAASLDPRTTTTVILNSYAADSAAAPTPVANAKLPPMVSVDKLTKPTAYFIGGPQDTTYAQSNANFAAITTLPVFDANLPVGHTGAYPAPDPRWSKAVLAWLDWRLKDDGQAGRQFKGADCGLCKDPAWTVKSKNLDDLRP